MKSKSVGYRFAMLYRMNSHFYKEGINRLGINKGQVPFIAELLQADREITQDELSKMVEIDKAATARALDQLEKKGLVLRRVNPENRRQKLVSATTNARLVEKDFFSVLRSSGEIFMNGFSDEEKNLVMELMDRMLSNGRKEKYGKK